MNPTSARLTRVWLTPGRVASLGGARAESGFRVLSLGGCEMEKVKAIEIEPSPGTLNPDNPREVYLVCPSQLHQGKRGKYLLNDKPRKLAAAGYKRRCPKCAQRERELNPDTKRKRSPKKPREVEVSSGSVALLWKRSDEDIRNLVSYFRCGICGCGEDEDEYKQSWEGGEGNDARAHFCPDCGPLAEIALKPGQHKVKNAEREAIYAKVKSIVEALRRRDSNVTAGSEMPFCVLAEEFKGRYQRMYKSSSLRVVNHHFKSAVLFFGEAPINKIGDKEVDEFHHSLLSGSGRRRQFAKTTAVKTVETLKRILSHAVGVGWLEGLPSALGQISRSQRISGRILTLAQNGNGQKNGHNKQGRPGIKVAKCIHEAVKAVAAEWAAVKNNGKSPKQQAARITQADLLPHLDSIKKKTGTYEQKNKRVSSWFTRWGIRAMFPTSRRPFDEFVLTVVKQLVAGETEEKIVSSIQSRLNSTIAGAQ